MSDPSNPDLVGIRLRTIDGYARWEIYRLDNGYVLASETSRELARSEAAWWHIAIQAGRVAG